VDPERLPQRHSLELLGNGRGLALIVVLDTVQHEPAILWLARELGGAGLVGELDRHGPHLAKLRVPDGLLDVSNCGHTYLRRCVRRLPCAY
jgi:hypothetical protein